MKQGKGRMVYGNGDIYDGNWDQNLNNGFGQKMYHQTNSYYIGYWKDG